MKDSAAALLGKTEKLLLREACKGFINIPALSRKTGIPEYKLRISLAKLLALGLIDEKSYQEGLDCSRCPLKKLCGGACPTGRGIIRVYRLTARGSRLADCRSKA